MSAPILSINRPGVIPGELTNVTANIVDLMINGEISMVINTPMGKSAYYDDTYIRRTALQRNIPCVTTLFAAVAITEGMRDLRGAASEITSLQEQHGVAA